MGPTVGQAVLQQTACSSTGAWSGEESCKLLPPPQPLWSTAAFLVPQCSPAPARKGFTLGETMRETAVPSMVTPHSPLQWPGRGRARWWQAGPLEWGAESRVIPHSASRALQWGLPALATAAATCPVPGASSRIKLFLPHSLRHLVKGADSTACPGHRVSGSWGGWILLWCPGGITPLSVPTLGA